MPSQNAKAESPGCPKKTQELAQASERDKAKKSVGFAVVTGESDRTVAAAVTGGSEKKGPDSPALASETKAEEYKYDPDEKGETWDIYKQRAADKSMVRKGEVWWGGVEVFADASLSSC